MGHISELDPTHRSDRIARTLHLSVLKVVLVLKEMTTWLSHPTKYENMDGWMDEWMDRRTDGWMDEWMNGWMNGWMDRWMDGQMNGWMDGWMDE